MIYCNTEHLDVIYAAQNCEKSKFILQPWYVRDSLEVFYTEFPCDNVTSHPFYRFCEGSGWGNEEATVACREQGYQYGTGCEYIYYHLDYIIVIASVLFRLPPYIVAHALC